MIRYAYAPVCAQDPDGPFATSGTPLTDPEEELPALAKIARRAAEPLHTYGTDEDSRLGPYAPDPRIGAWDLGGDPIAFARERTALVERVLPQPRSVSSRRGRGTSACAPPSALSPSPAGWRSCR